MTRPSICNLVFIGARLFPGTNSVTATYIQDLEEVSRPLPLYLEEVQHSPTGFEWGYGGSGPAQLAYAILRFYFELSGHEDPAGQAQEHYQDFKRELIARLNGDFNIRAEYIAWYLEKKKGGNGHHVTPPKPQV